MVRFIILAMVLILGIAGVVFMGADTEKAEEAVLILAEETVDETEAATLTTNIDIMRPVVSFSHTETFYDTDIFLELSVEDTDAIIFFTLDGSPPSRYSQVYSAPIHLRAGERIRSMTVKAAALYFESESCEGVYSPITTNSYIASVNVWSRFTPETYIFMLSADPFDLYDYYRGIAIEGFLREDYIENVRGGRRSGIDPPAPANFNIRGRDSERDFYVEVYDYQGNTLIHQAAGGRIQGGWSRAHNQKSWRLIARSEYSDGKFRHAFFDEAFNYNGQLLTRFDRLILRNGANDREHANIRDEVAGSLAAQAGFPDVQSFAPAAVFLNGEYYGFAWLKESLCYGYLVQTYGGAKENYFILKNNERIVSQVATLEQLYNMDIATRSKTQIVKVEETGEIYMIEDLMFDAQWVRLEDAEFTAYNDWLYVFELAEDAVKAGNGFIDDAVFEEFCSLVDIDNFILYYAIQTYIDNRDWPGNNMKMWRYYADENEIITSTFNDGKWRFLMYDVEFSLGIYGQGNSANTLSHVLGGRGANQHMGGQSVLLQAVLQREDMREKFANTICDLMDGAFSTDNIINTLAEIAAKGDPEIYAAMNEQTVRMWDLYGNREQISQFARRRLQVFPMYMLDVFELPEDTPMFTVTLSGADGADAWLNTRKISENCAPITTSYYTVYSVPLWVQPFVRYEFVSWEINGVHYYEADMRITANMADSRGDVRVILHTDRVIEGAPLFINELCTGSGADWITLYNPNMVAVSTRTYFLSDDADDLQKWKIPAILVHPEETITIVMSNNSSPDILMKPQTNFSLSAGETLFLTDTNGEIIAMVDIPDVERGETLMRERNGTYTVVAS